MEREGEWRSLTPGFLLGGKYELEAELGRGGMGAVFRAVHRTLGERVAVKVQLPTSNQDRAAVRFEREIKAAMRLRGEHAVRLLDAGQHGDVSYFVMELLEGQDLKSILEAQGQLPLEETVGYALQACEALAEAHALGIIHRDLKPANLFLTRRFDGQPLLKVLDFGVAKATGGDAASQDSLTSSSASLGTPMYMAPEQIRDAKRVGVEADLWALGVVLFELWTGRPPFFAETVQGLLATILSDEPDDILRLRPDTPPALAAAVRRCLKKNPTLRPRSVYELAAMLAPMAPSWARVPRNPEGTPPVLGSGEAPAGSSPAGMLSQTDPEASPAGGGLNPAFSSTEDATFLPLAPSPGAAISAEQAGGAARAHPKRWWQAVALVAILIGGGSLLMRSGGRPSPVVAGVSSLPSAEPLAAERLPEAAPSTQVAPAASSLAVVAVVVPPPAESARPASKTVVVGSGPRGAKPGKTSAPTTMDRAIESRD